jgi:hypothetical protein
MPNRQNQLTTIVTPKKNYIKLSHPFGSTRSGIMCDIRDVIRRTNGRVVRVNLGPPDDGLLKPKHM